MIDECPMNADCPGYDRDRRVCLIRPADCEFAPADAAVVQVAEGPRWPVGPDAGRVAGPPLPA
jgi:hypothetical protein